MIIVNNDLKICGILDNILVDSYAAHSTAIELFRSIMYNSLKDIARFKKDNKKPIRVASSLSTIKRMIAPGEEVFRTITPFCVMRAEENMDESLGALITPVSVWNPVIPYNLNTTPIYSHIKTFDVSNNVEIRLGYSSATYTVGMNVYESTEPLAFNIAKKWDWSVVPGTVYRRMVEMKVIVPRLLIAEYCNWVGVKLDFDWFVKEMNEKSEEAFRFSVELDSGSGKYEVTLAYATTVSFRGAASSSIMREEEGDTDKYVYFQRAFLMSINIPTHFVFGRESDKRFNMGGDKLYVLDDNVVSYGDVTPLKKFKEEDIVEGSTKVYINNDDLIDGYELVERYVLSDEELDMIKDNEIEDLSIDVFSEIIISEEPVKYDFLKYCITNNVFKTIQDVIRVYIKSDNIKLEVKTVLDKGNFIASTSAIDTILKDRNCCIYVYFKNSEYRKFIEVFMDMEKTNKTNFNIKQSI